MGGWRGALGALALYEAVGRGELAVSRVQTDGPLAALVGAFLWPVTVVWKIGLFGR